MGKAVGGLVSSILGTKTPKIDTSGQEKAAAAAAAAQEAANNLQANFAQDLKTDNVSTVVAGAGADAMQGDTSLVKRKRPGSALSSQLGINA